MKTKLLSLMLVLRMTLTLVPVGALAADAAADGGYCGKSGENLTWSLNEGVLTIGGTGEMADYDVDTPAPWSYDDSITSVVIQEGVTGIGTNAFSFCSLETISLPDGLESIGANAFSFCGLEKISLPDSLKSIGANAFSGCKELTEAKLPQGISAIADGEFSYCSSLVEVNIPDTVKTIGAGAFSGCTGLKGVSLPEGVKTIGKEAFSGCSIEALLIPSGVVSLGENCFSGLLAGEASFDGTPARWEEIGGSTCGIPADRMKYLRHEHDFGGAWQSDAQYHWLSCAECGKIADKAMHTGLGGETCPVCKTELTENLDDGNVDKDVTWKLTRSGVLTIGGQGKLEFATQNDAAPWREYKDMITGVVIGSGITEIRTGAFSGCPKLEKYEVEAGNESFAAADGVLFDADKACLISYPAGKAGSSYTIPETVKEIGERSFLGCTSLAVVTIPESVTIIGTSAFADCASLKKIDYPGSDDDWNKIKISEADKAKIDGYRRGEHKHSYTDTVIKPTCTERGYTVHACSCGENVTDSFTQALGHDYKNGLCTRCGTAKPGGSGGGTVGHAHNFEAAVTEPTCTSEGFTTFTCSCGESYTKDYVAALAHETETVNAIDASCAENGYTGDLLCSICGNITKKGEIIKAAGHKFAGGVCSVCGERQTGAVPVFGDVKSGEFYYDAVQWAVLNGVTKGTGATTFSPENTCTRYQIVMFLWRASGCQEGETSEKFADVKPEDEFYKAVRWASARGITRGTGDGKFQPYASCTRAQIVTFLYRAMNSPAVSGECRFSDVAAGAYYCNAVIWATGQGITKGTGGGMFTPDSVCTRGEAVTFLFRALNK